MNTTAAAFAASIEKRRDQRSVFQALNAGTITLAAVILDPPDCLDSLPAHTVIARACSAAPSSSRIRGDIARLNIRAARQPLAINLFLPLHRLGAAGREWLAAEADPISGAYRRGARDRRLAAVREECAA